MAPIKGKRKSYKENFITLRHGICPDCGADGAALEEAQKKHARQQKKRYRGHCPKCGAERNFTNPKCEEWYNE